MEKFTRYIVSMMQSEELYETQGGPIILSQVVKVLFLQLIYRKSAKNKFELQFSNKIVECVK